jgi:solute:Na+ symporter, SSS family
MGTAAAAVHHGLTIPAGDHPGIHGAWIALVHTYPVDMAQNFWTAIWAFLVCFSLTVIISVLTPKNKSDEKLKGLVYSLTPKIKEHDVPWYKQPATLGILVILATIVLNLIFA